MRRRWIGIILIAVIFLLSCIQVVLDYIDEKELDKKSTPVLQQTGYAIFIEIEDKALYLLQNGKCIKKYTVASGKSYWPSPVGSWKIVNKGDWGEGFGGRWMGLNVTWGTYGIHGTSDEGSIGSAASHGCVRMFNDDIKELYDTVPVGTPVLIVNGSFGPFGTGFQPIEPGDRGADVLAIQKRLAELGYFKGYASGIYDDALKTAIHDFQKKNNLKVENTITEKDWLAMGFRKFQ